MRGQSTVVGMNSCALSDALYDVFIRKVFNKLRVNDDETLLYTMEQALVLILVIGRWLLPKGDISRDQLSQLLLIYVGTAADIMEFTEIIKDEDIRGKMLESQQFVNAVILFWSVSLFQFTLTVYAMEGTTQRLEKEKEQLEEELRKIKEEKARRKRGNRVAPSRALYTNRQQAGEQIKLRYIRTSRGGLEIKPDLSQEEKDQEDHEGANKKSMLQRLSDKMDAYFDRMQNYTELVSLLIPMLMQDGPFLIMRLIVISYYHVYHDTLYFLTVKNALVVMLQVYRIFVLYYKPPAEDEDELFPEYDHSSKLANVQTAIRSVQHTRLAIRLVSRLQSRTQPPKAGRIHPRRSRPSRTSADVEAARISITSAKRESVATAPQGAGKAREVQNGKTGATPT